MRKVNASGMIGFMFSSILKCEEDIGYMGGFVSANFSGANLRGANLENASLYNANLHDANLREANLSNADLRNADLSEADLQNVDLRGAYLDNANMSGADLRGADLSYAKFRTPFDIHMENADLRNAKFEHVFLKYTIPQSWALHSVPKRSGTIHPKTEYMSQDEAVSHLKSLNIPGLKI